MVSICIKENESKIQDFLIDEIKHSSIPNIYYSKHNFKIYKNIIVHYKGNNQSDFYSFMSTIISDAITNFYEPKIIKRLLLHEYFYFDSNDKKVILDDFNNLSKKCKDKNIYLNVNNYIKENKSIVLEGFVNFRLKKYTSTLDELLENAVNKFVLDKEYLEFVSLLRIYVDSKIPEPCILHLIYVNHEAILLDENINVIEQEMFSSDYMSDISFSSNDYALNTLIGKLPQTIHLHLISPKDEFINTLELIFGEKIKICDGCEICNAYKLLNLK